MKLLPRCLLLTLLAAGAAEAQSLSEQASSCIAALESAAGTSDDTDNRTPLLGEVCVDYYTSLIESEWADVLRPEEAYYADRAGVESLIALATLYETPTEQRVATRSLNGIVEELKPFVPDEEPSLWSRFVNWVEDLLESDSDDGNWLSDWLNSFSMPENAFDNVVRIVAFAAVLTVLAKPNAKLGLIFLDVKRAAEATSKLV